MTKEELTTVQHLILGSTTDEELSKLTDFIAKEIERRDKSKRGELIEKFEKAFADLEAAGISIICKFNQDDQDSDVISLDVLYYDY